MTTRMTSLIRKKIPLPDRWQPSRVKRSNGLVLAMTTPRPTRRMPRRAVTMSRVTQTERRQSVGKQQRSQTIRVIRTVTSG